MARPLSDSQIRYAADDVLYLHALRGELVRRLQDLGRVDWAREEFDRLLDEERYVVEPDDAWRRVRGGGGLDPRGALILRELARWREKEARSRDLARPFVLRDTTLLEIARKKPRQSSALREIRDLRGDQRRRDGDRVLRIVEQALSLPSSAVPKVERDPRIASQRDLTRYLQQVVAGLAEELAVAPEVLAQRRLLDQLVRRVALGEEGLPEELRGWREAVVGVPLLEALAEARSSAGRKLAT